MFFFFSFNVDIQDGHQKWQENDFWEKSSVDSADTLWVEIALSLTVSKIDVFLQFTQKFKMDWRENYFFEKLPVDSADTLRVINFVEIVLSRTTIKINAFLRFTQKFKMATKNGGKIIFGKSRQETLQNIQWIKNFIEITLSRTVSKINVFLPFTQKFKMATKNGRKTIFGKSHQETLKIPCGSKILSILLYLAPFLRYKRLSFSGLRKIVAFT